MNNCCRRIDNRRKYAWGQYFNQLRHQHQHNINTYNLLKDIKIFSKELGILLTTYKEKVECSICLNDITVDDVVATKCHHTFHDGCLEELKKTHTTCPLCRKNL